jgi:phosphatidate cytidylyltransferase
MLKLRILTALILIPLVLLLIFCSTQPYFMAITALAILGAAWEWSRLTGWIDIKKRLAYVLIQALFLVTAMLFLDKQKIIEFGLFLWLFLFMYLIWARQKIVVPNIPIYVRASLGCLILTLCWLALQKLYWTPFYLLFMLLIIWLADTVAYFSGRLWGKHALAPGISPKKTWEGFIISLVITFLVAIAIQPFFISVKPFSWQVIVLILATYLATVAGDLFESQIKRLERAKDSSHLLPGHGGILDRMDSLLAAAPVFTALLPLLGVAT